MLIPIFIIFFLNQVEESDIQEAAEHSNEEFIIATGEEAESILSNKDTRVQFVNELIEVSDLIYFRQDLYSNT